MSPNPEDLLAYNLTHRILICRSCQYAIQKSAVSSHLLRHKIYREERQLLVAYSADLDLSEPEDVFLPSPGGPAIDGLPVLEGYACTRTACGKLCASLKRMKKHLSEDHSGGHGSSDGAMRTVMMQTFFRGTKIRYFEVSTDRTDSPDSDKLTGTPESSGSVSGPVFASRLMIPSRDSSGQLSSPFRSPVAPSIDLYVLRYFHYYTSVASSGLPTVQGEPHFWKTTVVQQALKHEWLMCGILTIAAHLLTSAAEQHERQMHVDQMTLYIQEFSTNSARPKTSEVTTTSGSQHAALSRTSDLIENILRCARWSLSTIVLEPGDEFSHDCFIQNIDAFTLQFLVKILRKLARSSDTSLSLDPEAIFAQAKSILDNEITCQEPIYTDLCNRLRALPNDLSNTLGRPNQVQDVLATLSATASLVVQCTVCFTSEDVDSVWRGMSGWLMMLDEHFILLLNHNDPTALVLVAYWAVCVRRAYECGLWWLRGLAEKVVSEADRLLELANSDLRPLLRGFGVWGVE